MPRGLIWMTLIAVCWTPAAFAGDAIEYNRDIRPILAENCFACHGPDSAARKADLRLDRREAAVEMLAIVPGKADESGIIDRINSTVEKEVMPPPQTKNHLKAAEKELLAKWIAAGAEYQPHWSFIAPVRPTVPVVKQSNWVRNPIDAFVLAKLEEQGLMPAAEADRRTLCRRLSLDLTGLPPSPEVVREFLQDDSSDAYEKLVDRLLASPHWGEHRGRYWLDAARYADSNGLHFDNFREMWSYRDWVIQAFNSNQPFDQFTVEQLAGDLLPKRSVDQQVASGFNRCNLTTSEGGSIAEEYLVLYTRDRTETTSQVWLGLTTGCAVCHDHKFDPVSQREFYQLAAFFNNTTQEAMDGNVHDTPPVISLPIPDDRQRAAALASELEEVRRQAKARNESGRADFNSWLAAENIVQLASSTPSASLEVHIPLNEGTEKSFDVAVKGKSHPTNLADSTWEEGPNGSKALKLESKTTVEIAKSGNFDRQQPFTMSTWVKFTQPEQTGSLLARMDEKSDFRGWDFYVEGNRIGMHLVRTWPTNAIKSVANQPVPINEWHHVLVSYDGSSRASGIRIYYDGVLQAGTTGPDYISLSPRNKVPLKLGQRNTSLRMANTVLNDVRLYDRGLNMVEIQQLAKSGRIRNLAAKPADQRSDAEKEEIYAWWLATIDESYQKLFIDEAKLLDEQARIKNRSTVAHVMQEKSDAAMAFILARGEYDKRGDKVQPQTPSVLPAMSNDLPKNRLGLAQWLLAAEHPLTARVTVNRFWQEVFGTGIVRTTGDFGVSGELPNNQPLLDWMAVEFRESGWDVKRFFRLLVTSNAYRQAAIATPEKLEKDPQNRLLSRGPRFRMDAEMIRDYALASSGLLVKKLGGPSVKPYQPPGVWESVAMPESNTHNYVADSGEKLYRRSLYTFWKRAAPPASMDIFNAPSREFCTVRRERTNTPLQALMTLNDPQMVEAARRLAENVLKSCPDDDARIDAISSLLLSRPLKSDEVSVVKASLADLSKYYEGNQDAANLVIGVGESKADDIFAPQALAAWTMLTNELMNLDEVLNK